MLGLILGLPLPGGPQQAVRLAQALQGLLDFCYLAQYSVHSDDTIHEMQAALKQFHEHKQVFIDLSARKHFMLPKLHYALHYAFLIKWLGTTDNYNTEYTERLHIDLAKHAYRATNRKDELTQMTTWLERKEKIQRHDDYVQWRLAGSPSFISATTTPSSPIHMTHYPTRKAVSLDEIEQAYQAPFIRDAIARYIIQFNNPDYSNARVEQLAANVDSPVTHLPVYHKVKSTGLIAPKVTIY